MRIRYRETETTRPILGFAGLEKSDGWQYASSEVSTVGENFWVLGGMIILHTLKGARFTPDTRLYYKPRPQTTG